ncbi:MAG: sugar transferase, partial [Lachnospiraceae bacterium]|nr:sugar transferase [Lachnospiraceae bacterium]
GVPVVATLETGADYVIDKWIDEVMVYLSENNIDAYPFIRSCREMGMTVHTVLGMQDDIPGKRFIESMCGHTVLTTSVNYLTAKQAVIKRAFDIFCGLIGSVFAGILLLIFGPLVCLKSPGPVIFKQERVGTNGKKFKLYKLRTMVPDAEQRKKELEKENRVQDGLMFKVEFDPRVIGNEILPDGTHKTGLGEFIRKWSIDEFPQFFNILKGDMSVIGTRPPTVDEWNRYSYHHRARMSMRPGLTGMWQVSGRSEITDFEEVVNLDTYYITHFSIRLDIRIFFKTIVAWFSRKGAM